jgi:hypothetical protein
MFRVCCLASFLSVAACISSPEFTLVDETRDAPVSPDGRSERVSLVIDREGGVDSGAGPDADGGVLPHTERDARADTANPDASGGNGGDDDDDDDDDDDPGNGKGKPPKKKND